MPWLDFKNRKRRKRQSFKMKNHHFSITMHSKNHSMLTSSKIIIYFHNLQLTPDPAHCAIVFLSRDEIGCLLGRTKVAQKFLCCSLSPVHGILFIQIASLFNRNNLMSFSFDSKMKNKVFSVFSQVQMTFSTFQNETINCCRWPFIFCTHSTLFCGLFRVSSECKWKLSVMYTIESSGSIKLHSSTHNPSTLSLVRYEFQSIVSTTKTESLSNQLSHTTYYVHVRNIIDILILSHYSWTRDSHSTHLPFSFVERNEIYLYWHYLFKRLKLFVILKMRDSLIE